MTTVSQLIAKAREGTATNKELGILCGIRSIRFNGTEGVTYMPEHFFTLKEWRNMSEQGEEVSLKEAVGIVPELSFLLQEEY
jgi:hypothetical protein